MSRWRSGPVVAALLAAWLVAGDPGSVHADTWTEFGPVREEAPVTGEEVREAFFAFLLDRSAAGQDGRWTGTDVEEFAAGAGLHSRFPLDLLVSVTRRRPTPAEAARYPGARVLAHWDLELTRALDRPMPYDILGYHPGSLRTSRRLELVELAPGDPELHYKAGRESRTARFRDVRVFAVVKGYLVLDADGFVDALLGSALDDAWTVGLVTGWEGERRIGLGVSLGRKGRRIYGEFDFVTDRVLPHGRPAVSALSAWCRQWLDPDRGQTPPPWQGMED